MTVRIQFENGEEARYDMSLDALETLMRNQEVAVVERLLSDEEGELARVAQVINLEKVVVGTTL